jgi:sarcosine oxidase, subunit beta
MAKAIVCGCEDVTVSEVEHAIAKGHTDIESVKRFTGFGTGMCQGKQCVTAVARMLSGAMPAAERTQKLTPFTPRPPLYPTELGVLRNLEVSDEAAPGGVPPQLGLNFASHASTQPVKARSKIVIIGGGVMGLSLAWNLLQRGETDIVVLERGYLCAGASGRNGGGVRMQWGTPSLIQLAKRSIELMGQFARAFGINVWLRQGGYLFLAKRKEIAERLERGAAIHHRYGVPTEIISGSAAQEIVPQLDLSDVLACSYNKKDGVIFPWPFVWGYAQALQKKGVAVETFTQVTGFDIVNGRINAVKTSRGSIQCDRVVLAAGAWSPEVAALAGVDLPNRPHRHEICSTEPLKPFLGPLVSVLDSGLYFSQSMRGEIVGGMGDHHEPAGMNLGSTARFLARYSQALTSVLPISSQLKVLRQWSGPYDVTPDNSPILGETPQLSNLLQMSGFVGHGFMMAPAVAERMAQWMATGQSDELFEKFTLSRFAEGRFEREEMIIG